MLTALLKMRAQLEGSLGRTPTLAELATEAELPLDKVVEVLRYAVDTVSLDEPVRDDGDAELGDFVEDRNATAPFDARGDVAAARRGGEGADGARRAGAHDPDACASVSTVAASARSRKWPSTSVSPVSASVRSRPGRCRSCGTRRPTSAPASCSKPSEAPIHDRFGRPSGRPFRVDDDRGSDPRPSNARATSVTIRASGSPPATTAGRTASASAASVPACGSMAPPSTTIVWPVT